MEVMRAREKEQAQRELVALLTGSCHYRALLRWHGGRVGRSGERGRKGGRSGSPMARQKVRTHGASGGSGNETREKSGDEKDEWIRRRGGAVN